MMRMIRIVLSPLWGLVVCSAFAQISPTVTITAQSCLTEADGQTRIPSGQLTVTTNNGRGQSIGFGTGSKLAAIGSVQRQIQNGSLQGSALVLANPGITSPQYIGYDFDIYDAVAQTHTIYRRVLVTPDVDGTWNLCALGAGSYEAATPVVYQTGPQGPTGATPAIQIGTVTTLSPGNPATASITGSSTNPVLNLGIPQGAAGTGGGSSSPATTTSFGTVELAPGATTTINTAANSAASAFDAAGAAASAQDAAETYAAAQIAIALTTAEAYAANASNLSSGSVPVARLPVFGASGSSHAAGVVPDPGSSAGSTRYLREDGTWATPAGGGSGTVTVNGQPCAINSSCTVPAAAGTLTGSALPSGVTSAPGLATLAGGAVGSAAYTNSSAYDAAGAASTAQTAAQSYAANASNLSSGTVALARLPAGSTRTATGATDTLTSTDITRVGGEVTYTNSSGAAVTLPTSGLSAGDWVRVKNLAGSGQTLTVTPASGLIDGNASITIYYPGDGTFIWNGTTWTAFGGYGVRGAGNLTAQYGMPYVNNPGTLTELAPCNGLALLSSGAAPACATTLNTGSGTAIRVNPRSTSITSSATPSINTDTTDNYIVTALAVGATFSVSGTPVAGQKLLITVTDGGTAEPLAFSSSFEASSTFALPTTTVASTRMDIGFIWNAATSKWRCVGIS